ncbi:hypothetical protein, conserved [Angomonas deanei]|uniref:Uncharacterized protein n=1 Tax=Angomonas deanei TaxID=59799 RepID=A0A7G2CDN5_9TRYP|nr:hypothetical protein, conserved [Angomonas deanei]
MTSNKRESFTPLALGMFSSSESATQPPKNVSILGKQSFNSSQRTEGESSNRVIVHSPTSPAPRKGTGSTSDQSASPVMFDWAGDVINGTSSNGLVDAGSFSAGVLSSKSASPFRLRKSSGRVGQYFNANTSEISGENKEENRMNPASRTSSSNMIGNII